MIEIGNKQIQRIIWIGSIEIINRHFPFTYRPCNTKFCFDPPEPAMRILPPPALPPAPRPAVR
jgi:hypothetical protein